MRKNLAETRICFELTQVELAKKISTSPRNYQRLEAGTSNGSMRLWINLSEILEKPIDYLMKNVA